MWGSILGLGRSPGGGQPTPIYLPGETPWTEEPGGLQSMASQRVGHDWGDLARTAQYSMWENLVTLVQMTGNTMLEFIDYYWIFPWHCDVYELSNLHAHSFLTSLFIKHLQKKGKMLIFFFFSQVELGVNQLERAVLVEVSVVSRWQVLFANSVGPSCPLALRLMLIPFLP